MSAADIRELLAMGGKCLMKGCATTPRAEWGGCCEGHWEEWKQRLTQEQIDQLLYDARERENKAFRVKRENERVVQEKLRAAALEDFDPLRTDNQFVEEIVTRIEARIDAEHTRLPFINDGLTRWVPLFGNNLIVIGAQTGGSKTTTQNMAVFRLVQAGNHPLVLTNEASTADFYRSLACLSLGFDPNGVGVLSTDERTALREEIRRLVPLVSVIDDATVPGGTTSVDGLRNILKKVQRADEKPDALFLDFFQNVATGSQQPWAALREAALALQEFTNATSIPVVVFVQLKPHDTGKTKKPIETPIEHRIKLCRDILVVATFALEVIPQAKHPGGARTILKCHKAREAKPGVYEERICTFERGRLGEPRLLIDVLAEEEEPITGAKSPS